VLFRSSRIKLGWSIEVSITVPVNKKYGQKRKRYITYKNQTKTITEWAKLYNQTCCLIRDRLKSGWSIEKALTTPARKINRKKNAN